MARMTAKALGYCGARCLTCFAYKKNVSETAKALRRELRTEKLKESWKEFPFLADYASFKKSLDGLAMLRCTKMCRGGGGNPWCKIRRWPRSGSSRAAGSAVRSRHAGSCFRPTGPTSTRSGAAGSRSSSPEPSLNRDATRFSVDISPRVGIFSRAAHAASRSSRYPAPHYPARESP